MRLLSSPTFDAHVIPHFLRGVRRGITAHGVAAPACADGVLDLSNGDRWRMSGDARSPRLTLTHETSPEGRIQHPITLSLGHGSTPDRPVIDVTSGKWALTALGPFAFEPRLQTAAKDVEQWGAATFRHLPSFPLERHHVDARALLSQYGLYDALPTAIREDNPHVNVGWTETNECTDTYPSMEHRGGLYLGVGALQNYDHMTAVEADGAYLLDVDPKIVEQHHTMLSLIEMCPTPQRLLSFLTCVPLRDEEKSMAVDELVLRLLARPRDDEFRQEIRQLFSEDARGRIDRVLTDAPAWESDPQPPKTQGHESLRKWWAGTWGGSSIQNRNGFHWLRDPERYEQLRSLQLSGRIVVKQGNVAETGTLPDVASAIKARNETAMQPLPFSTVYLSNVPSLIHVLDSSHELELRTQVRAGLGVKQMCANLIALPSHPLGSILSTTWLDVRITREPSLVPDPWGRKAEDMEWDYLVSPLDARGDWRDLSSLDPTEAPRRTHSHGYNDWTGA